MNTIIKIYLLDGSLETFKNPIRVAKFDDTSVLMIRTLEEDHIFRLDDIEALTILEYKEGSNIRYFDYMGE